MLVVAEGESVEVATPLATKVCHVAQGHLLRSSGAP
jgi:hypothetical protein